MNQRDIQAFLERDWSAVERMNGEYWAAQYRMHGPQAGLAAAHALFELARRVRPELPTPEQRAVDFENHVALKRALDCAAHATKLVR